MIENSQEFWEDCWKQRTADEYAVYLSEYNNKQDPIVDLLKQHGVQTVCDAACGFGAYSLMLASNGFQVEGFDISPTSVEVTKTLLRKYDIDSSNYKAASVLDTGYKKQFDAVTARSVLDHLYVEEARKGLDELLRIVKPGGIVIVSFDGMDEDDLKIQHEITEDGSILYRDEKRNGMVYHFYADEELSTWLKSYSVVDSYTNGRGERFFAIQKQTELSIGGK